MFGRIDDVGLKGLKGWGMSCIAGGLCMTKLRRMLGYSVSEVVDGEVTLLVSENEEILISDDVVSKYSSEVMSDSSP